MVPLMMQKGYRANGWLGLILGTRLYYSFAGAESDDEAAFEQRMEGLCREIGSRGQHQLSESVPTAGAAAPTRAPGPGPAPAPQPALAPAAAPAPAPAPASLPPTLQPTFSPSVQAPGTPQPQQMLALASPGVAQGTFSDTVAFMREERETMEVKMKEQRLEMEAKLEEQRREIERLRQDLFESQVREQAARAQSERLAPHEAISTAQVQALSARLAALHAARLLSDDELFGLEDCIADFVEAKGSAVDVLAMPLTTISAVGTVCKLAMVSESVAQDAMFARQLRRKFA